VALDQGGLSTKAGFGSRSADRADVSFLREMDGGFRKEQRAAQGRLLPICRLGHAM